MKLSRLFLFLLTPVIAAAYTPLGTGPLGEINVSGIHT